MRQLAGTKMRYRRAHAAPLAGLISGRATRNHNSLVCAKMGSSTNEVRGDICAKNVLALIDDVSAATEPERLAHISLGQENPRMRMNAAPG